MQCLAPAYAQHTLYTRPIYRIPLLLSSQIPFRLAATAMMHGTARKPSLRVVCADAMG
jgi:hypothetical protein